MKAEIEAWNRERRKKKEYIDLKREYDRAEGHFVQRVAKAAEVLGLYYIDACWMMSAFRGPNGAGEVLPRPANYDATRDAEPEKDRALMRSWTQ